MSTSIIANMWRDHEHIFERIGDSIKKLEQYDQTQKRLKTTNVSSDADYQRAYNSYYRMRQRPVHWYEFYFTLLEQEKSNEDLTFEFVLRQIDNEFKHIEPSFASKLVATVRPERPVYDDIVCKNLAIQKPSQYKPKDIKFRDALDAYENIEQFFNAALRLDSFAAIKLEFDQKFSKFAHFTDAKKLDILLWQWRT